MDPAAEYLSRLKGWRDEHARDQRLFIQLGNLRLAVAVAAAALAYAAYQGYASGWLLALPLIAFIALVVYHERVVRRQQLAQRGIVYYERGLARLDDKWSGQGNTGERFQNPDHIYSGDLDVFGRGGLFELICVARTAEGEQRLANWLLSSAPPAEVRERQAACADLRPRIQLREDLALLGDDIRAGVHASSLAAWGAAPAVALPAGVRCIAPIVAIYNVATFAAFMLHGLTARPFLAGLVAAIFMGFVLRKPVAAIVAASETPAADLQVLSLLLARLEGEAFEAPALRRIRTALETGGAPASASIRRLGRWMEFLDSTDHVFVRAFGPVVLWRAQAALGIEAWRVRTGPRVAGWIEAVAELEALSSLASLSFERPGWATPELLEPGATFEATALSHPLMSPRRCVPNDVTIGDGVQLMIVSGSNMSGKSTLMRSIGLNTVLAWAGGPVAARSLRLSPLAVGASIRTVDSLQDGRSRFYAEITRVRQVVDLTNGTRPALFLLDELLSGTNSHDRRIGAEGILRELVSRGAIGLVTTHDLALTQIVNSIDGRAINVHFEDRVENGQISFDYKMRPGVVERSNALELMRAVGLPV